MAFDDYRPAWAVQGLTPTQRLILLALAEHRNRDTGLCCPSYGDLVKETGVAKGTVSKAITKLGERIIGINKENPYRCNHRYTFCWNDFLEKPTVSQGNSEFPEETQSSS